MISPLPPLASNTQQVPRRTAFFLLVFLFPSLGDGWLDLPGQPAEEEVGGPEGGQVHRSELWVPATVLDRNKSHDTLLLYSPNFGSDL